MSKKYGFIRKTSAPKDKFELARKFSNYGIAFSYIPEGNYGVGYGGELSFAQPTKYGYFPPTATPLMKAKVGDFLISQQPLRLEHWRKLVASADLSISDELISSEQLIHTINRKITRNEIKIYPSSGDRQSSPSLKPTFISQQTELNPVLELEPETAIEVAKALGVSLPYWHEWEIATRGPYGQLYPWGNEIDLDALSLERQDYSTDTESVMGYYRYDKEIYFVHSFGDYANKPSPFGLLGLARAGREWNLCHKRQPLNEDVILRSISDLGSMAYMIPGVSKGHRSGNYKEKMHLTFSGPPLPCYAPRNVGDTLYNEAGFRLVLR